MKTRKFIAAQSRKIQLRIYENGWIMPFTDSNLVVARSNPGHIQPTHALCQGSALTVYIMLQFRHVSALKLPSSRGRNCLKEKCT